jgi:hypothetical protein
LEKCDKKGGLGREGKGDIPIMINTLRGNQNTN